MLPDACKGETVIMRSAMWRRVDIQVSVFTAVIVALLSYSIFMVQYKITYRDMLRSLNDQAEHIYTYIGERFEPRELEDQLTRLLMLSSLLESDMEELKQQIETAEHDYETAVQNRPGSHTGA